MPYPKVNLLGKRFGHLKVVEFMERNAHCNSIWACVCDCGELTTAYYQHLVQGDKKSCGKCGIIKRGVKKGTKRKD
jgi:hypothetical protein